MPRIKHQIQVEHLNELKSLVQCSFGRQILNIQDCNDLSIEILQKTKASISTDTLRRFFGLIQTNSQPSLHTLEVYSKYAGYKGYSDFTDSFTLFGKHFLYKQLLDCLSETKEPNEVLKTLQQVKPSADYYTTLQQLILLAFQRKDILFFKRIFIDQPGFEWKINFKYEIFHTIQLLGKLVENNDWLQYIAIENYIGLPYSFDYFIEWYVAEDRPYYLVCLKKYKKIHRHKPEKQMFYWCLLALRDIRNRDYTNLQKYSGSLRLLEQETMPNNILQARILGVHYASDSQIDAHRAEKQLLEVNFELLFPNIGDRVTSLFFLIEYLYEVHAYHLIKLLFDRWSNHDAVSFSIWTRVNWYQLCVYIAHSYYNLNQTELALKYLNEVNITFFELYKKQRFLDLYFDLHRKIQQG